ncbi:MAG: DUF4304 domain-containing protein [Cyanobacteria bacterium HKST-UBA02]|nr:DUF4304 domain-containing protein [Cyanobacteria bacterium HKST-UBA02]
MDDRKEVFFRLVSTILKPLGFKRKGTRWTKRTEDSDVTIHLQESSARYSFYLNAEYRFHEAPKHRYPDLSFRIDEAPFLNLETDTDFDEVQRRLPGYLTQEIVPKILSLASLQSKAWNYPPIGAGGGKSEYLRAKKPDKFGGDPCPEFSIWHYLKDEK